MNIQQKIKLKELVDIRIGLPLERKKATLISEEQFEYKSLTLKSFTSINSVDNLPYETFTADSEIGAQYFTKENDVIIRLRSPNSAIHINSNNTGLVVSSLMAIVTNVYPNILDSKYLSYYLNSQHVENQLVKNLQGTSVSMAKKSDFLELEIKLLPIEKQQKIVAYLENANQEINLLQDLINEKNKLKTDIFEILIK
ncbi:MAG: restriction endonuclease subunit S [Burkholderiales bacterium]|nr:restriction endonuclease subunit S [Burkholderiales bacterium]